MAKSLKEPEKVSDIDGKPIGAVLVGVRARQQFKSNNLREIARAEALGEVTKVQINLDTSEELNPVLTSVESVDPYGRGRQENDFNPPDANPAEDLPGPDATSIPAPTPPPPPASAKQSPTPVTSQARNTISTARTATSARSVPAAAPAKPAAGNLTRQQYDAAVANLAKINSELAAAQNQLSTLYKARTPNNAAQIKALGTTIARLKNQSVTAKQTVDRLKKSI